MIFSRKIYKLVSGKNITLFQSEPSKLDVFVFNKLTQKYTATFASGSADVKKITDFSFNSITKINDNHSALCYDKNISITDNKNYDL